MSTAYELNPRLQVALQALRTALDELGNDCAGGVLFDITFENLKYDEFLHMEITDPIIQNYSEQIKPIPEVTPEVLLTPTRWR